MYTNGIDSAISPETIDLFVKSSPELAHIKNMKYKRYEVTNYQNLKFFGMTTDDDFIGKKLTDINEFMKESWGNGVVDLIENIEREVISQGKTVKKQKIAIFNKSHKLTILNIIKTPIFDKMNSVKNILTVSEDITNAAPPMLIYRFYRMFKNNNYAVRSFLKHYDIIDYFKSEPTEYELIALMSLTNKAPTPGKNNNKSLYLHLDLLTNKLQNCNLQFLANQVH